MILIDSNILIYSAEAKYRYLRDILKQENVFVSIITKLEVLGYHRITPEQITYFKAIFRVVEILQIDDALIGQAISYRQKKSMSVADSIIAATAKNHNCELYTNNIADFKNIKDFEIVNPIIS